MKGRGIAVLAVALAVAGAGWALWSRGGADGGSSSSAGGNRAGEAAAGEGAADEAAAGGGEADQAGSGGAARRPPAPVRMRSRGGGAAGQPAVAQAFAAEERDARWAAEREDEVRRRAAAAIGGGDAPARAGPIECRARTCRVPLASDSPGDLARALEQLGDERGFYGLADDMLVTPTRMEKEGVLAVEVYLRFER